MIDGSRQNDNKRVNVFMFLFFHYKSPCVYKSCPQYKGKPCAFTALLWFSFVTAMSLTARLQQAIW